MGRDTDDPERPILTPAEVDRMLAELAEGVDELRRDHAAAADDADRRHAEDQRLIEEAAAATRERHRLPHPRYALAGLQAEVSRSHEDRLREAYEELVGWWAHAATVALFAALGGGDPSVAAMTATGPWHWVTPEGLREFGRPVRRTRLEPGKVDDSWEARDAGSATALRELLWGETWETHRLPALPPAGELTGALRNAVPTGVADEVAAARRGIDAAVAAGRESDDLDDLDDPDAETSARSTALWRQYQRRTDRVAEYAGVVTRVIPDVRTGEAD
jgi:hypothetical protein